MCVCIEREYVISIILYTIIFLVNVCMYVNVCMCVFADIASAIQRDRSGW